ncbi:MAG: hypothetical protein KDB80_04565 [Planctomycetes bacterium]|nr:hypothetical protein [Planctomycetota bacterium]
MHELSEKLYRWFDDSPRNRTWFALGWTTVYFAIVLLVVTPTYKVTDNSGILSMIEDGAETPFISQILSGALTFLYHEVSDRIPWFGYANFAALFWALALFVHALSSIASARTVFLPLMSLFSLVFVMFLIRCGYNSSSILLTGIATLAFVAYAREQKLTKWTALACGLALAYGFLFRPRGMQGAMVVIGPALLAFRAFRPSRYSLAMLLLFVLPIGVAGTAHVVWKTYGVSDEYRKFREFNRLRGKFHSYPISKANKENHRLFQINHWQRYHYLLFKDWFYVNEDIWNLETLRNIFKYTEPLPEDELSPAVLADACTQLFEQFKTFLALLPLCIAAIVLARDRRVLVWSSGYLLYLIALSLYLRIALRLPERIGDPVFTLAFVSGIWILLSGESKFALRKGHASSHAFLACWAAASIAFAAQDYFLTRRFAHRNAVFENRLTDFNLWFVNKVLFIQPAILKSHDQNPLKVYEQTYESVPLGWRTQSPQFYDFLRRHEMQRGAELMPWVVDNPRVFFVWARGRIGALIAFLRRDYGIAARVRAYSGLSDSRYLVFQLLTDPDPPKSMSIFNVVEVPTPFDRKPPVVDPADEEFEDDEDR